MHFNFTFTDNIKVWLFAMRTVSKITLDLYENAQYTDGKATRQKWPSTYYFLMRSHTNTRPQRAVL